MKEFIHRRFVRPVSALLTQGISPQKIALSLALGLVIGIFPVLGTTTLLCAVVAVGWKLNLPAMQLVNYIAYPLQLVFLVPFIRFGEALFRADPIGLSAAQMLTMAKTDLSQAIDALRVTALHAAAAWVLVAPLLIFILYQAFLWMIENAMAARKGLHHTGTERV